MIPFPMGMNPSQLLGEMSVLLAEVMADDQAPDEVKALAKNTAVELMKAGAIALALGVTDEHLASCDHHDHSPAGFLEHLASLSPERNGGEEFEVLREEFRQGLSNVKAEESLKSLPETLHVKDILGETEEEK